MLSLRCTAFDEVNKYLAGIKSDKYRMKSMGKEAFTRIQEKLKLAGTRLLMFAALYEVGFLAKLNCKYHTHCWYVVVL